MPQPPTFSDDQILAAMRRAGGNKSNAARLLGCSPNTLYNYLVRMGLHERVPARLETGVEAVRVEVGLSALVDARVVFDDGWAP